MFCSKCGDAIEPNEKYCNKCGNLVQIISTEIPQQPSNNVLYSNNINNSNNISSNIKKNKKLYIIAGSISVIFIVIFAFFLISSDDKVYFSDGSSDDGYNEQNKAGTGSNTKTGAYQTSINYDNVYENVSIKSESDAKSLIIKDSKKEKDKCSNDEIGAIENRVVSTYGITAVNFCELDTDFAKEIENVAKSIYNDYPTARGYLTNLTLTNTTMSNQYIAVFMPVLQFASSNSSDSYPWVFKTLIGMNSKYFLNTKKLEASVKDASNSGHFPKNTTRYSPVAHEFGHYLSFLAMLSTHNLDKVLLIGSDDYMDYYDMVMDFSKGTYSKSIIDEAYKNYKTKYNSGIEELEFRQSISAYAVAKDSQGNYIYDETIAEAFHDYYINGNGSEKASIEIVDVLKKRLEGLR